MKQNQRVAILGGRRIPFVKSFSDYLGVPNQEFLTTVIEAVVKDFRLQNKLMGDVAMGGVIKHPTEWNLTRESVLGTSLHPHTPGYNVQRACATGLETAIQIANKIALNQIEVGIAGGVDTNSDVPATFPKSFSKKALQLQSARSAAERMKILSSFRPSDLKPIFPGVMEPRTGMSMGQHTEKMVQEWKITRQEQDQLALESHQKAAKAYADGFYSELLVEFHGIKKDAFVRADTNLEKLGKLKPAFEKSEKGTLTAGNSTPLTDGASAVLLASEKWANDNGFEPLAYLVDAHTSAVNFVKGEGLLMAPTFAVAKLLERNNLSLQDFDFYEIHEAFAGQVLCNMRAWESATYCKEKLGLLKPMGSIDRNKMNVKGGSLAIGHPFGATGGRILASLAKILKENKKGRGLISICAAGGMGVAAIVER